MTEGHRYVLITSARNEEAYIETTIKSVIAQTVLPKKWVIVSDGSTDSTNEIIRRYEKDYGFIQLLRIDRDGNRDFRAKYRALEAGLRRFSDSTYDFIGILDADVSFDKEYFQFLLGKCEKFPQLGVVGTPFIENQEDIHHKLYNLQHVHGACQLFKRECFEKIFNRALEEQGCLPVAAVMLARMYGWQTRSFTDKVLFHHRKMGTAEKNILSARFHQGRINYLNGNLPLWQISRVMYNVTSKPYVIGTLLNFLGYLWAFLKREKRVFSKELIKFRRREQRQQMTSAVFRILGLTKFTTTANDKLSLESMYSCDEKDIMCAKINGSIDKLDQWLQSNRYEGYEPFDGLLSYLRPLTFGNCFAERVLEQSVLRCPVNIRPLIGIGPRKPPQGMGYLACGYLKMWIITGDIEYKNKAVYCLGWLIDNHSAGYSGFCWGNKFDHASRGGRQPKDTPTVVWSSLIGQAFLNAYEILGEQKYLDVAQSICNFILKDNSRVETQTGTCMSYHPLSNGSTIHNANMLSAAMLARTAKFTCDTEAVKVAKEAMEYSCSRQLANGAWYYGEDLKYHWIDNFHTGYNLDSLKCYIDNTNDKTFEENLRRGFKYYKDTFFEEDGKPKYYNNSLYPINIQCAAQAIDTLSYFAENDDSSLNLALKVADWTIENMQDKRGFFCYRKIRWKKVKIPMLHWGQATMFCALANLLSEISKAEGSSQRHPADYDKVSK
jgi:glycosyltransferase involved in cell wall biosynthesis